MGSKYHEDNSACLCLQSGWCLSPMWCSQSGKCLSCQSVGCWEQRANQNRHKNGCGGAACRCLCSQHHCRSHLGLETTGGCFWLSIPIYKLEETGSDVLCGDFFRKRLFPSSPIRKSWSVLILLPLAWGICILNVAQIESVCLYVKLRSGE